MKNKIAEITKEFKKRKLDNAAKFFPLFHTKKYSTVFRLSVILNSKINPKLLQKAVENTLEIYKCFKVKLKKGFYWHYLKFNNKKPIIKKEEIPCQFINPNTNNDYLFKVTYGKNRINIDIYHSLTDGNNGLIFFKEIIYSYLELKFPNILNKNIRKTRNIDYNTDNSYLTYHNKEIGLKKMNKRAYKIMGQKLKETKINITHQIINLKELKKVAKSYDSTITQYLTAVLIYSIYKKNYLKYNGKKPINVCIPINLKKYFHSKTLSNFFSYIDIVGDIEKINFNNFEEILLFIKEEFKNQLSKEEVLKIMSNNVKLGTNVFLKNLPLFLKIPLIRLLHLEIKKRRTITYSNIGRVGFLSDYHKYIKNFYILISPDSYENIKCSSCSYENKFVFSKTSSLENTDISKFFFNFLRKNNISVKTICESY